MNASFESIQTITISHIKRKPIEFYLKYLLPIPKHTVGVISSRGGMGKTFLSLRIAAEFVKETNKKALCWFSEDEKEVVAFRFDKICDNFGVDNKTASKIHYVTTATKQFAIKENGVFKANYEAITGLRKDCLKNNIGLVVIDPLLAFYGGDENDNSQARIFMQVFLEWAKTDGINILFIHHGQKGDGSARGAGAFIDATRFAYELHYPMDKDKVDFNKKDMGYRNVRLTKDNHNAFYHFAKLSGGGGEYEMQILPSSKEPEVVYYQPPIMIDKQNNDAVNISIANHNDQFNPKGFEKVLVPWNDLMDVITMGKAYSPSIFKDGHRHNDNFIGGNNVVFLDIDDGMTLEQAKSVFKNMKCILITTKSHQKEKNGIVCDRFRVAMMTKEPIDLDANEYRECMSSIFEYFGGVADKATKDPARFFFSSPQDSEVIFIDGLEKLDWREIYDRRKKINAIEIEYRKSIPKREYGTSNLSDASMALSYISSDCDYPTWVECGMALASEFGDSGYQVWDDWSRTSNKYKGEVETMNKWRTFKNGAIGIGTLYFHAKSNGYTQYEMPVL